MVKYRLLLLIIGLSELGWAMLVPPPLPSFPPCCYSEMENERRFFFFFFKKGDEEREKEHPRKCRCCCDAGSTGKWPQRRCEGESESGAWRHSALVVPAGQCKLFSLCIKEKEGGREGGEETPRQKYHTRHIHNPVFRPTISLIFCNAYLSVSLPDFCHNLSVCHLTCLNTTYPEQFDVFFRSWNKVNSKCSELVTRYKIKYQSGKPIFT